MCDSKELLVGYLYRELDSSARREFETHLSSCQECQEELAGLASTRAQIASWTPPEPDLGFHIVRRDVPAVAAAPRIRLSPAWGLAAAAVLVMGVAAGIANIEVRFGDDGVVLRTGWNRDSQAVPAAASAERAAADPAPSEWRIQADLIDRRLRDLEASALAYPRDPAVTAVSASGASDAEILRRVREIVAQSETRQQRALALRLAQLTRDFDTRRRVDLAAIDHGMSRLQSTSGAEVKQYRDLIQRLYQVTYQQTR